MLGYINKVLEIGANFSLTRHNFMKKSYFQTICESLMQFEEKKRVKKKTREKERRLFSNWRIACRKGRKKKWNKTFTFPFDEYCVRSFFLFNHAWRKREKEIHLLLSTIISFPFLKRRRRRRRSSRGKKKWKQRLLLSTGPRAFFTKKFPFISLRVPLFCVCDLGNFTCISTKKCSTTIERLTGKEYHSKV